MSVVSFKRGSNLNNLAIADGQFIVNTAERSIYVDVGTERLRVGDFVSVANIAALPTAGAHTTALYYVEDINCLAKWDGSAWIQINRDTGVKEVKVEGTGNAITAASYDATTRVLTLTKGETFATPAVVDTKISDKVGEIEGTVKSYIDTKTEGIASDEALTALGNRVTTAESEIDDLQAAIGENGSVTKAIDDAKKAGTDAATAAAAAQDTANSKVTMAEVEAKKYATQTEAQGYANAKDAAIAAAQTAGDTAQSGVDAINAKIGTVAEGKTVVKMIEEAKAAATYDDTAVKASIKAIADDYLKAADKTTLQSAIDTEQARAEGVEGGLRTDVDAIKNDYLKSADKTELSNAINGVKEDVDAFFAAADVGDAAIDTLKELQNYISTHGEAASTLTTKVGNLETTVGKAAEGENPATGLVKSVADNATAIAAEETRAKGKEAKLSEADATNLQAAKDYADGQITALKIGDYAKKADLDSHTADTDIHITAAERTKWDAAEVKAHTHTNKNLLDSYTQTEENLADAVTKKHSHANAAELAKIETGDKAKWDAAQANAESTAATALAAAKKELEGKITAEANTARAAEKANADAIGVLNGTGDGSVAKALSDAKAYTDTLQNGQVTTNKNDIASLIEQLTWGEF